MKCPACSSHLVTLELSGIEVDYCFECRGIWLDRGELEQLLSRAGSEDSLIEHIYPVKIRELKRKCPGCGKTMEKIMTGGKERIILDRCDRHGIWTEGGELKKILALSCKDGLDSPLTRILDDMFAEKKGECV
jgi:Zn-finger nucleic acid-binding protein